QQPGLERDEGDRVRRAHRVPEDAAAVGMQAARDVERQDRTAHAIGVVDERGMLAGDLAAEPDAEKPVDHDAPRLVGDLGRARRDCDAKKTLLEPFGDHASVAAVVAGAGKDQHVLRLVPGDGCRHVGGRGAGPLHQCLVVAGGALDAPDVLAQVKRTMHPFDSKGRSACHNGCAMFTLGTLCSAPVALANWIGAARREETPSASILLYHGTPRRDAAALERQLRWLKRRFSIVPLRSIVAAAGNGGALSRKVALTFDDGLRSNVEVAYPILHKLAIPATFFVCPGLVDRASWLWTHEARSRLARLDAGARRELAAELGAPEEIEAFVEWMKKLDLAARRRVEARLRDATPRFAPTDAERDDFDLAGWEALRR